MTDPYNILITVSILVVLSYLFNIVSNKLRIPSVILLLATGVGLSYLGGQWGYQIPGTKFLLELLGIVGLIFIVLEGTLDLNIRKERLPLIGKSLLSSLLILLATAGIICFILTQLLAMPLRSALIYAVPLGVISSAIAIPSVNKLSQEKKEFIVYESTFSDILGIMLFNYVMLENPLSSDAIVGFFVNFIIILLVSVISTVFLLFLLNYTKSHVKFYLIFAILILVYSISKLFHLPSLLLVLIFGLMLNNASLYIRGKWATYLHVERLAGITHELKLITAETAFIVRTFFFLLFGYSINLVLLANGNVWLTGSLIMATILLTRYVFLRFISRSNLFPELFIAPRGLITIVLFYSIPAQLHTPLFNEGILFFVIILSSLIMMGALVATKTPLKDSIDDLST